MSLRISIVTPSFNQGPFLEETIRSVLDQRYPNLEYIIIDGGSVDESVGVIKKYSSRLTHWESEPDRGHAHAINKGFEHSTGEIMAWINSDDKYTPWSFEVVAQIFSQFPHIDWIVGFNSYWNSSGAMTYAWRQPKNIYDFLLGNFKWVQQESVFWRRSLWERSGGKLNEEYQLMVDGELWTRFFLHSELYCVDCILAGYRIHSGNRAVNFQNQCLVEMSSAISKIRDQCPGNTLATYRKLRCLQAIERWPVVGYLPLQYLLHKSIWRELYRDLSYKRVFHENGRWVEGTLPWSIH